MALEVIDFRSKRLKNSSKKIPPLKAIEVAKRKMFQLLLLQDGWNEKLIHYLLKEMVDW